MRITTRGRYALRASLALAKLEKEGGPVSINNLSEYENISSVFLEQIFFKLRKAGLVSSVRGPGGGFRFARLLDEITVKQILDAAGEDLDISFCDKREQECSRVGECLSHPILLGAHELIKTYFEGITVNAILEAAGETAPDNAPPQHP